MALAGVGATCLISAAAFAHHSYAMFDQKKEIVLEGTIKEYQWTNPHAFVQVLVKDPASGNDVEWSIECGSPNGMIHRGWTAHSATPGDKAVIRIHPLLDGRPGGSMITMTINGHLFDRS
jgi:hypothetical protein